MTSTLGTARGAGPAAATEPIVQLSDVFCVHRTSEGDAAALQGTTLEVGRGELLCVLGPSGAGKSTLLRVIAGLQTPSAGIVRVLGLDIGRLPGRARARVRHDSIGFLGQRAEALVAPDLRVRDAVALPLGLRGVGKRDRQARAAELLDAAGLGDRGDALPAELSGGERQRVAVCGALAHRPRLLLAGEPTGELDAISGEAVRALIAELTRAHGTTAIVVSHDPATAALADRSVRLRDGRVVEDRRGGEGALVVGQGGWLQLPPELLASAGIGERARQGPDGLVVMPADDSAAQRRHTAIESDRRVHTRAGGHAPSPPDGPSAAPAARAWEPAAVTLRSLTRTCGRGAHRRDVIALD